MRRLFNLSTRYVQVLVYTSVSWDILVYTTLNFEQSGSHFSVFLSRLNMHSYMSHEYSIESCSQKRITQIATICLVNSIYTGVLAVHPRISRDILRYPSTHSDTPPFTSNQAVTVLRLRPVSAAPFFRAFATASFLVSACSTVGPPSLGLPRLNCHSHGSTS
jgi:hypothetical protein